MQITHDYMSFTILNQSLPQIRYNQKIQGYSGSTNPNNPLFFIIFIEHYKR